MDECQQVSLPVAPEGVALRGAVLSALTSYPEARAEVSARLADRGDHG